MNYNNKDLRQKSNKNAWRPQAKMEEQQRMLDAQCKLMEDQKQALLGMQSQMALLSSLLGHPSELHDSEKWIVVENYHFGCLDLLEIWFVFCWAHFIGFLFLGTKYDIYKPTMVCRWKLYVGL